MIQVYLCYVDLILFVLWALYLIYHHEQCTVQHVTPLMSSASSYCNHAYDSHNLVASPSTILLVFQTFFLLPVYTLLWLPLKRSLCCVVMWSLFFASHQIRKISDILVSYLLLFQLKLGLLRPVLPLSAFFSLDLIPSFFVFLANNSPPI